MSAKPIPPAPGAGSLSARLAEILRVDHAGELGAVAIYRGQRAVLDAARGRERISDQLADMEAHEAAHLARLGQLVVERGVRPTALARSGASPASPWAPGPPCSAKRPPTPAPRRSRR